MAKLRGPAGVRRWRSRVGAESEAGAAVPAVAGGTVAQLTDPAQPADMQGAR